MSTMTLAAPRTPVEQLTPGIDQDFLTVLRRGVEALRHYSTPVSQTSPQKLFAELTTTWKEETAFSSSVDEIILHPAYQQVIGMGRDALPLIFADLQREPSHWFWALYALTGVNPVPNTAAGDMAAMTEAWLNWGKTQGYRV